MKEILKKIKADTILSAVLCIILGVVLLLYTEQMTDLLCKLLAAVLIVMGVAHMIIYFTDRMGNKFRLIGGEYDGWQSSEERRFPAQAPEG